MDYECGTHLFINLTDNNSLTGSIPSELERLTNLNEIFAGGGGNNLTGSVVLHHVLYTTCVVCDERTTNDEQQQVVRLPAAGGERYNEANGIRCNELIARFQRHDKNFMTINECNDLKEKCFVCG